MDRLGANPFILASVVLNLGLMGLLYWQGVIGERERARELELLYKNRTEVGQLLLKCRDGSIPEYLPPARPYVPIPEPRN